MVDVEAPHAPVVAPGIQVPDVQTLGQGQPRAEILGVPHLDVEHVSRSALGQHAGLTGRVLEHGGPADLVVEQLLVVLVSHLLQPRQLHLRLRVEGVLAEVDVVKVGVHVEAGGAKVKRARDVGYDALPPAPHIAQPHPHVPVPGPVRASGSRRPG